MNHSEKIVWMHKYCSDNGLKLDLEGECGFGRECVGITLDGTFPDYEWYDDKWEEVSGNGDVWTPEDAYHKHPCVAVLGRGEDQEGQLYDWLKWFDDNNFKVESGEQPCISQIEMMLGRNTYKRMVKAA